MELDADPVVGGVPGGVFGDPGLLAVHEELVHGRLVENSCRSMLLVMVAKRKLVSKVDDFVKDDEKLVKLNLLL